MHSVVELVSEDLCGPYDDWCVRILFAVACEDAAIRGAKFIAELLIDGIGKGLKGEAYQTLRSSERYELIAWEAIQVFPEPVGALTRTS